MEKRTITIPLDWLQDVTAGELPALREVLDDIASKAKTRGLTPEILESLLNGN
jgi:hypothetical protein